MERNALRFAQLDKITRQAFEILMTAVGTFVLFLLVFGWALSLGLLAVALMTYQLAGELRKAMGFASNAEYKAFKLSPEGLALGLANPYQIVDPFFVDPALASPALQKAQARRLTARKISFSGGIASGVIPVLGIVALIAFGSTAPTSAGASDLLGLVWVGIAIIWLLALGAAFGGLFAAFAARLKIQRLVIFGG